MTAGNATANRTDQIEAFIRAEAACADKFRRGSLIAELCRHRAHGALLFWHSNYGEPGDYAILTALIESLFGADE